MSAAVPGLDPNRDQRRAADPRASVWVGASAGSGKTKVLADRVLNLLLTGTASHRILCLTFTKAAAAEMANRIARRLSGWAVASDKDLAVDLKTLTGAPPTDDTMVTARRLFAHVLDTPGGMKIQTVHAFCQSLLGRFPVEAGVPPHFEVLDDRDAETLLLEARDQVLATARAGVDPQLADALAAVTERVHETNFAGLMASVTGARGRIKRLLAHYRGVDGVVTALRRKQGIGPDDTADSVIAAACAAADDGKIKSAMTALLNSTKTDQERGQILATWLAAPEDRVATWETYTGAYLTGGGTIRARLCTKGVEKDAPDVPDILAEEAARVLAVAEHLRAVEIATATEALLRLGGALIDAFETAKRRRVVMDYDDLILSARKLVETSGAAWVLFKLDGGIDHVLVDEAQDTSPDQWAVVRALTGEFFATERDPDDPDGRTVFAVGDRKQSIYSFQGADPDVFEDTHQRYAEDARDAKAPWSPVDLHVSFRSTQAVLDAVNAVFKTEAARDGVVLAGEDVTHIPWRKGQAGMVEIWPPVDPEAADDLPAWKPPVERIRGGTPQARLAGQIAQRIKAMIDNREILESKGRPIRAGDVMVLVRRRTGFVEDLTRELKRLDVETAGVDRMVLTEQLPVMDLMALGQFLLLPGDDLTLATVLKGPLIGLTEEDLFDLAHGRPGSLWAALQDKAKHGGVYQVAYGYLGELLARTDYLTPHDLYAHVLGPLGGRKAIVARLGPEAEDPVDEFVNQCLAYERVHAPSLQGFLHWVDSGGVEIKRDLEEASRDAVRILTVHGSKGLEAPIVFLPDTLQKPTGAPPLLWEGREPEDLMVWLARKDDADGLAAELRTETETARDREYRRLLYVAMTRAEDRLYVCGWNTNRAAPDDAWYPLIRDAVEPLAKPVDAPVAGAVLRLTSAQEADVKEGGEAHLIHHETELPDWVAAPPPPEPSPPRPLAPSRPDGEEPPVRSPLTGEDTSRFRRGKLIHRLLQSLPDLSPDQWDAAAARYLAQAAGDMSEDERSAIAGETLGLLTHADFADLFGPGSRAEVPIVGVLGGHVVAGQVDRLVVTEKIVRIVDFKTNRPPPERIEDVPDVYWRQMAAYRAVLGDVWPDRDIECCLLWTDTLDLMPLDPKRLNFMAEAIRGSA